MNESDEETVAAVVAFIDDFYESDALQRADGAAPSDGEPPCTGDSAKRTQQKKRQKSTPAKVLSHNHSRERQRRELQSLREEEKTLVAKVKEMTTMRSTGGVRTRVEEATDRQALVSMWKELASRQLKKRSAAEAENKSLRERVMEQRRVIKSLQRLLASQVREDPLASARLYSPAWIAICADEDPQRRMQLFEQLTSRLRQVYVATDSWMKTSQRLAKGTNHYSDSRVITMSSSLIAVETVSIHRFPFPFRTTGNAYWNLGVKRLCGTLDFFQEHATVEGAQTVLSGKAIAYEDHASGSDGIQFRTHVASQRFDEDGRIAIVNASRSESMHVKYQHLPELTLDNQLWSVFCPSESTPDDACVMMSFGRVFFDLEAGWANAHQVVPVLFKYFATTIHQYADMSADMMEDWILADETKSQRLRETQAEQC